MRELFEQAGQFHGHLCPGLAIGVRAAAEALRLLDVKRGDRALCCIAESRACYLDGIQCVFGTTLGNGALQVREEGVAAFDFYDRAGEKNLRLELLPLPEGLSREEKIERLLCAPLEDVFAIGPARFAPPER